MSGKSSDPLWLPRGRPNGAVSPARDQALSSLGERAHDAANHRTRSTSPLATGATGGIMFRQLLGRSHSEPRPRAGDNFSRWGVLLAALALPLIVVPFVEPQGQPAKPNPS